MSEWFDGVKMKAKAVAALIAAVFLLSLFARGHFNAGGGAEPVESSPVDPLEGHGMCVLGTEGCGSLETNPDLRVEVIPEQGSVWCPNGPTTCVEFVPAEEVAND